MGSPDPSFVHVGTAAKAHSLSVNTVRRWAERGLIPGSKTKRGWVVPPELPDELIAKARNHPRSFRHRAELSEVPGRPDCVEHLRTIAQLRDQLAEAQSTIAQLVRRLPA